MKKDSLGDRMKSFYEERSETRLSRRTPVIVRIDGKAFHTFTKHFTKPYDRVFHNAMNRTTQYLCQNIQGCKFGYTQSDEISLLLTDYDTLSTSAWFDYRIQKMCSVAASIATSAFAKFFDEEAGKWFDDYDEAWHTSAEEDSLANAYRNATGAIFDARVFNLPKEEVTNYFIWRQQDATRNAIQMLGQCYFSHKELNKKSCNDIQEMLFSQHNINFNKQPAAFKRGVCVFKTPNVWVIDEEPPIFTEQRELIEERVYYTEV